ncbi:AP-4 complex subunit beta-1 [Chamberlinius hualienensis]
MHLNVLPTFVNTLYIILFKVFKSYKMNQELKNIATYLQNFQISHDPAVARQALEKLIFLENIGCDITKVLPSVIKVLPANDVVLKKLTCLILMKYGFNKSDIVFMTHNTIQREFQDQNPLIRSLILKAACHLRAESYVDILNSGLGDENPQVRRTSVLNCGKLHKTQDSSWNNSKVDELYAKLRDEDPIVVTNCLVTLNELLQHEQGIAINKNILNHLLSQINNFTEWGQIEVLKIIPKYKPKTEEEMFDILNALDFLFLSQTSAVVTETYNVFKTLLATSGHSNLIKNALLRACNSLKRFVDIHNPELTYFILEFFQNETSSFESDEELSSCLLPCLLTKHGESSYCKVKKIQLLSQFVNPAYFPQIFEDICVYLTDFNSNLSTAAVHALSEMADNLDGDYFQLCIHKLIQILDLTNDHLVSQVLVTLQKFPCSRLQDKSVLVTKIHRLDYNSLTSDESKCSYLWILSEYGDIIPQAPYILEDILKTINGKLNLCIGLAILKCGLKLFFIRPPEFQFILGRIFEICISQDSQQLKHEVEFHYTLLRKNVDLCKSIVMQSR